MTMDFRKKMKLRFYTAFVLLALGAAAIVLGVVFDAEYASPLGAVLLVMGVARIVQYRRIMTNEDTLRKYEVAETDERNLMLWTKARAAAFSLTIVLAALVSTVLYLLHRDEIARTLSFTLYAMLILYYAAYAIYKKKY